MKKLLYILCLPALTLVGCLKDKTINTDGLNKTGALVEIIDGGLGNFGDVAVLSPSTITDSFVVNLASTNTLSSDLTITIGLNDAVRTAYNSAGIGLNYQQLPDSCYSIKAKTGVIKAGQRQVTFYVTFYPTKVKPTINYMAAIGILDAQGQTISGNFGTLYYHFIGNPLAGTYASIYNRWNTATATGTPATVTSSTVVASPDAPTTLEFQSGYGAQNGYNVRYVLTFTNNSGVYSNFAVSFNSSDLANNLIGAIGASVSSAPTILIADGVNKHFKFTYAIVNSTGAPRIFTDEFTKQ